ncbi:MAG TPA: hypothetical protein VL225_06500 [Vicinamibacterales bacterium]|nr:hypothetical protein [Vicinamibacterales bacterium]
MIFPVICPMCRADSGRRTIPQSPEVDTFVCGDCRHEWSEPAPAYSPLPAPPRPPLLGRFWQLIRNS